MKSILLFLLSFSLLALPLHAAERLILGGLGTATGTFDYKTTDSTLSVFNDSLDHDLSGSSLSVAYVNIEDTGFAWGGGYHSFTLSGESGLQSEKDLSYMGSTIDLDVSLTTDEYKLSGLFAMVGYNLSFAERFRFLPNLRLGVANSSSVKQSNYLKLTLGSSYSESSSSGTESESQSPLVISLPVTAQFDHFEVGLEYLLPLASHEINSGVSTYTFTMTSAIQLALAYQF